VSVRFGTALGLCLGVGLDRLFGDPSRGHPVAVFGACAAGLERRLYAPSRSAGGRHLAVCLLVVGAPAAASALATSGRPFRRAVVVAAATWVVLGGRSLGRAAAAVGDAVAAGDVAAARAGLPSLCGRDPEYLDAPGLVRATVESVAENTSDAVVAPLVWGALAGVPGLLLYRAVNTLDAMVGHRSERYRQFGTPAARLDDGVNWLPARLSAALAVLLAPLVGGDPGAALAAWRRDADAHPSPNAGPVEAAFAGALGVRLGGPVVYPYGAEQRPVLGDGREVEAADVARAVRLSDLVTASALVVCASGAALGRRS
jgi:adenosylcobinamide-phosphate synthase